MQIRFSERMNRVKASEIRELLKITERPEVISFAGGLPAPELFPIEELKHIAEAVLNGSGRMALQYATTEGYPPLREKIAERMNLRFNTALDRENILITCGSQQALDLTGKAFLDEGDVVLCESPTYLGALNAFNCYGPRYVAVPTDEHGMMIEELERIILREERVKLIYVVPDFQNPSGRTWSLERRRSFMELIEKYGIPVIEDSPYAELRFEGESLPSLKAMDRQGLVVFLGTFSKILCPGMRIGWVAAHRRILEKYIILKQGTDLHTTTLNQMEIDAYLEKYDIDQNIASICKVYKKRRDVMLHALKREMPANTHWTHPQGGLFTWVELPANMNAVDILKKCLDENVAFVPGGSFFPNGGGNHTLRLNYSNMPEDRIEEGIRRLARVLRVSGLQNNAIPEAVHA